VSGFTSYAESVDARMHPRKIKSMTDGYVVTISFQIVSYKLKHIIPC